MEEVLRHGQGDAWTFGRIRRVSHDVTMERLHERDARILAATAAAGPTFIIGFRLQCDTEPLNACRIASYIEPYSCNADT
jgi:hypothetical protein